jgi:hypothetical protein
MVEGVLALLVLGVVLGLGVVTPLPLLSIGAGLTAAGLSASAAVGWMYHRRLRDELLRRRPLPARWWWAPSRLHRELDDAGRAVVLPYFRAGLLLILLAFAGLFLVALGAVKAWLTVGPA